MASNEEMSAETQEMLERFIEMMEKSVHTGEKDNKTRKKNIDAKIKEYLETTKTGKALTTLTKSTGALTQGFKESAKTIGGSTGNFNDLTGAVTGTIKAVSSLASSFPIIGGIVNGLGEAAAELTGFAIGQTQAGFQAFQELSKAGQIGATGISELGDRLIDAGIPLATYSKLLVKNSEDLAFFSGSALKGGADFSKVLATMQEGEDNRLRHLGFSLEEIGDTIVDFQKLNRQMGFIQRISTDDLVTASEKYGKELDLISKITGKSREDIQKNRERLMGDDRFRAFIEGIPDKSETKKSIMDFLGLLPQGISTGMKDMIAAGGAVTTKEARQLLVQGMGPAAQKVVKMLTEGSIDAAEAYGMMIDSAAKNSKTLADVTKVVGDTGAGLRQHEVSDLATRQKISKDLVEATKKAQNDQVDATDDATKSLTNSMKNLQQTTANINKLFVATPIATKTIDFFSDALLNATDLIAKQFGIKTATDRKFERAEAKASDQAKLSLLEGQLESTKTAIESIRQGNRPDKEDIIRRALVEQQKIGKELLAYKQEKTDEGRTLKAAIKIADINKSITSARKDLAKMLPVIDQKAPTKLALVDNGVSLKGKINRTPTAENLASTKPTEGARVDTTSLTKDQAVAETASKVSAGVQPKPVVGTMQTEQPMTDKTGQQLVAALNQLNQTSRETADNTGNTVKAIR